MANNSSMHLRPIRMSPRTYGYGHVVVVDHDAPSASARCRTHPPESLGERHEFTNPGVLRTVELRHHVSTRVRRRRLVVGLVAAISLVFLALPVSALGGNQVPPAPAPSSAEAANGGVGTVYVVQPGETLWQLVEQADPTGDTRSLVTDLSARLGTTTIYPGEQIRIP